MRERSVPTASSPWSARRWWWGVMLVVITLVAYGPAYRAGFIWDDPDHVVNNAVLRDGDGLSRIWFQVGATPQYYPLVFTSFWLEFQFVRPAPGEALDPTLFHVTNVVLHALGALVLWRILLRLQAPGAWLAAAVFAIHPLHVESVAWITERKNTLSALMYLLAAWAYLRFSPLNGDETVREDEPRRWGWYVASFVLFLAALFSKTVTCSLPAALLLMTWWKNGRIRWRDIVPTIPMFVVGILLGLLTAWFEKKFIWGRPPEHPYTIFQALGEVITGQWHGGVSDYHYTFIERCLIAGRVVWFYASSIVWPFDLTFSYEKWRINAGSVGQWLYPLGAVVVLVLLWAFRRRIGRGPLTAALYFGGTLFPAMGFFDVYPFRFSFVADHFQHLASIGVTTLLCAAGVLLADRVAAAGPVRTLATAIITAMLVLLGALTWSLSTTYKSEEAVWRDTIARNPNSWLAHLNLAVLLYHRGLADLRSLADPNAAIDHAAVRERLRAELEESLALSRKSLELNPKLVLAHVNIGNVLMTRNDREAAEAEYRAALDIPTGEIDAGKFNAHNNLAALLTDAGKYDEAREHFEKAIAGDPRNANSRMGYGLMLARTGKIREAMAQYRAALERDPSKLEPLLEIAANFLSSNHPVMALAHCDLALEFAPEWRDARLLRERIVARLPQGERR